MRQALAVASRDLRSTYLTPFGVGCTAGFAAFAGVLLVVDLRVAPVGREVDGDDEGDADERGGQPQPALHRRVRSTPTAASSPSAVKERK